MYRSYYTKDWSEYVNDCFSLYDVSMGIITTLIIIGLGRWAKNKYYKNTVFESFFFKGLLFRLFCSWAILVINNFYYGGSDSTMYYSAVVDTSHETWGYFFEFMTDIWQTEHDYTTYGNINGNAAYYVRGISNAGVIRFGLIFNFLSFDSFIAITLWSALFAFIGTWLIYKSFLYFYPAFYKELGLFILFFPSAIYWSSAFGKEPICLGALGILLYSVTMGIFRRKKVFFSVLGIIASGTAVYIVKAYIIVAFAPALIFWIFLQYNNRIKSAIVRRFTFLFLIAFAVVGGAFAFQKLTQSEETKRYATDAVIESIATTQKNMKADTHSGSKFTLGTFDPTPAGLIKMFPAGVNATLFRPYVWEVRNPVMLLSAFESAFLLVITLILLYRFKFNIFKIFYIIIANPLVTFSLVFTLIFAGAIGISVFNFGALVRYKVPCLPFFGLVLAVLWSKSHVVQKTKRIKTKVVAVA